MNTVHLMGRLTKDIELRYAQSTGNAMTQFTLAVNRQFVKEGEERQADFIGCKAFGKTAEFLQKHFTKGSMLAIEGRIQTGSYEKEDSTKVYTTDVVVSKTHFCGNKVDKNNDTPDSFEDLQAQGEDELPF
jgi:single-strand DNA-binding protein